MPYVYEFLFIFFARLIDVSMMTVRTLMVVRGKRLAAALIGFVEVSIYIVALGQVFKNLNNWANILAYAAGFATGNYLGSYVEEKMAMGFLTIQVISKQRAEVLVDELRNCGYGVTVVNGWGRVGTRKILYIMAKRKNLPDIMARVTAADEEAFVTVMDARTIRGGFIGGRKDK